ncbi:MAG: HupE/UreJ family protein [Gammaproteobacteria bacterium]|nr:HupE/UreJ family protein [Gammaproteobacteria bacterium]MBQ0839626.1 HupE/UreJ family protein [Gammaproteobacteria bacterium]
MKPRINTMKTLAAFGAVFFSALCFAHTGAELAVVELTPGALLTGLLHPFTGIDHLLTLLLLGGAIALLHSRESRLLKRGLSGAVMLGVLLSWSFIHYSGEYFVTYALGFALSSTLLMSAGVQITNISQHFKRVLSQNKA